MIKKWVPKASRFIVAIILLQTLFFKFSGAPESVYIFSTLGVEPWGRWFAGVSELIAAFLILYPTTQVFGALMAMGILTGAILSHIFVLGIVVQNDGGLLFILALVSFFAASIVVWCKKRELIKLFKFVSK